MKYSLGIGVLVLTILAISATYVYAANPDLRDQVVLVSARRRPTSRGRWQGSRQSAEQGYSRDSACFR